MSLPTYPTVPFDRTMTLASSSGPALSSLVIPSSSLVIPSAGGLLLAAEAEGSAVPGCPISAPSFCAEVGDDFGLVITQQPLFFPSVSKYSTPFCFSNSKAASQKCRCRISLSRGRKSYSMSSRSMVSRCRRSTAVEMSSAISASSLPPCSMACNASDRDLQPLFVPFIPLRDASVEVPAVVIEAIIRL